MLFMINCLIMHTLKYFEVGKPHMVRDKLWGIPSMWLEAAPAKWATAKGP